MVEMIVQLCVNVRGALAKILTCYQDKNRVLRIGITLSSIEGCTIYSKCTSVIKYLLGTLVDIATNCFELKLISKLWFHCVLLVVVYVMVDDTVVMWRMYCEFSLVVNCEGNCRGAAMLLLLRLNTKKRRDDGLWIHR